MMALKQKWKTDNTTVIFWLLLYMFFDLTNIKTGDFQKWIGV